jgi:hypothetical protein
MSISMMIENRLTNQLEEVPICSNATYHTYWKRAATVEGLEMIQALGGLWVTPEYRDQFMNELTKLKAWATSQAVKDDYLSEMAKRVDNVMEALLTHPLDDYEISFG